MSLSSMIGEMKGAVPNYSAALARTHLRNSWVDIRNMKGWSFQVGNTGYTVPGLVNAGSATVTLGSPLVVGDLPATIAWASASNPTSLITQRQFRTGQGTIYNIIAYGGNGQIAFSSILTHGSGQTPGTYTYPILDTGGPGTGAIASITVNALGTVTDPPLITAIGNNYVNPFIIFSQGGVPAAFSFTQFGLLTLDRPWIDSYYLGSGQGYSIYQPYIVAPVANFQAWEYFMDVRNVIHLDTSNTRGLWEKVNIADPQRQIFSNPGNVIPHGVDTRPGSSTFGYAMYELYPQPQSIFVYQVGYSWAGPNLTDIPNTSSVPYPITEHAIKTLARVKAYEWAEANKNQSNPRGQGADYRFLMQSAMAEYSAQMKEIRSIDRDIYDAWSIQMQRFTNIGVISTFDPATGTVMSRNL